MVELDQGRRELDDAVGVVVVAGIRRRAVAGGDEDVARRVDRGARRSPDAALARRGHLVALSRERAGAVGSGRQHPASVVAAVTRKSAQGDVDPAVRQSECRPLLVITTIACRDRSRVDAVLPAHRPAFDIDRHEVVRHDVLASSRDLRDRVHGVRGEVHHRRAGDAKGKDVAAVERGLGDGSAHVGRSPADMAVSQVEGVQGVVLGDDNHLGADDDRLAVDGTVERGRGPGQARWDEVRRESVVARPVDVQVIRGPVDDRTASRGHHQDGHHNRDHRARDGSQRDHLPDAGVHRHRLYDPRAIPARWESNVSAWATAGST